jgi:hypothetical protein
MSLLYPQPSWSLVKKGKVAQQNRKLNFLKINSDIRPKSLWRWNISTIIVFVDIIHRSVFI